MIITKTIIILLNYIQNEVIIIEYIYENNHTQKNSIVKEISPDHDDTNIVVFREENWILLMEQKTMNIGILSEDVI